MALIDGNEAARRGFDRATWKLEVDGKHWKCASPKFGSVEYAVAEIDGKLKHDRPVYREAPHIITVPFGYKREEGTQRICFGLVLEDRPHGGGKFWGVPRGFLNDGETPEQAARREAGEEAGVTVIEEVIPLGFINPNPTFIASSGPVLALRVDLNKLDKIRPTRNEKIYKAEFFDLMDIQMFGCTESEEWNGGSSKDGVSLAALMKALCFLVNMRGRSGELQ